MVARLLARAKSTPFPTIPSQDFLYEGPLRIHLPLEGALTRAVAVIFGMWAGVHLMLSDWRITSHPVLNWDRPPHIVVQRRQTVRVSMPVHHFWLPVVPRLTVLWSPHHARLIVRTAAAVV